MVTHFLFPVLSYKLHQAAKFTNLNRFRRLLPVCLFRESMYYVQSSLRNIPIIVSVLVSKIDCCNVTPPSFVP